MADGLKVGEKVHRETRPDCADLSRQNPRPFREQPADVDRFAGKIQGLGFDICEYKENPGTYGYFKTGSARARAVATGPAEPARDMEPQPAQQAQEQGDVMVFTLPEEEDEDSFSKYLIGAAIGAVASALVSASIYAGRRIVRSRRAEAQAAWPPAQPAVVEPEGPSLPESELDRITPEHYELLENQELRQGDILPGIGFELGKPETYKRELLTINFSEDSRAHEFLVNAKKMAENGREHQMSARSITNTIAKLLQMNFSPKVDGNGRPGMNDSVGYHYKEGGCCRHKAALMHMALVEVGIRSRYVRGGVLRSAKYHAWVEVDVKGDGSYSYAVDPHLDGGVWGKRIPDLPGFEGRNTYAIGDGGSIYVINPDSLNVVWRKRPEMGKPAERAPFADYRPLPRPRAATRRAPPPAGRRAAVLPVPTRSAPDPVAEEVPSAHNAETNIPSVIIDLGYLREAAGFRVRLAGMTEGVTSSIAGFLSNASEGFANFMKSAISKLRPADRGKEAAEGRPAEPRPEPRARDVGSGFVIGGRATPAGRSVMGAGPGGRSGGLNLGRAVEDAKEAKARVFRGIKDAEKK